MTAAQCRLFETRTISYHVCGSAVIRARQTITLSWAWGPEVLCTKAANEQCICDLGLRRGYGKQILEGSVSLCEAGMRKTHNEDFRVAV